MGLSGLAAAFLVAVACGSGPSVEEANRSMTEFRLAATLHDEDDRGNRPAVMEHLRRSIELDPANARAHMLLGFLRMRDGEQAGAEGSLRVAVAVLEADPAQASMLAESRNMLGLALIHQRRYDEAIVELRAAAREVTNRAAHLAWGNLGWAHTEKGEHLQAIEALGQAVRIEPRYCEGHYRMGQAYFAQEDFARAEEALTRALEADERCQGFQDAWRLRGEVRARQGHREDAISDFERCVGMDATTETGAACRHFLESTLTH